MFGKLTLGTDRFASVNGGISDDQCRQLFAAARELGIQWLDTADSYASGDSERMIGRLAEGFRVVTKTGYRYGTLPGFFRPVNQIIKKALHVLGARQSFSPAYVSRSLRRSLVRLRRHRVDVLLLHNPPLEALTDDLLTMLGRSVSDGLVGRYGLSSPQPAVLRRALEAGGFSVLQTVVNRSSVHELTDILAGAQDRGIPVMAHGVTGHENRDDAIRFALSQPGVATVLTGTRSPDHLRENLAALT